MQLLREVETCALTEIVEVVAIGVFFYRELQEFQSLFFRDAKETCTRTVGHEVGIVALVASRVERLFLRTLTKTVAVVAESRWTCTRTVIQDGCRR